MNLHAVGSYAIGGADLWHLQLLIPPLEIQQTLLDADDSNTSYTAHLRQQAATIAAETTARVEEMILGIV